MARTTTPTWILIAVLFSTFRVSEALARRLHEVALDLYRSDRDTAVLDEESIHGTITNLRREAGLESLAGPLFEAHISTEDSGGTVRFLLTRRGMELTGAGVPRSRLN